MEELQEPCEGPLAFSLSHPNRCHKYLTPEDSLLSVNLEGKKISLINIDINKAFKQR